MNELYHSGVKGQKWYVRRYQNYDGSLTEEGRERLNSLNRFRTKEGFNQLAKRNEWNIKTASFLEAYSKTSGKKTNSELSGLINILEQKNYVISKMMEDNSALRKAGRTWMSSKFGKYKNANLNDARISELISSYAHKYGIKEDLSF